MNLSAILTGLNSITILPWRYDHRSRTAAVSRQERTGHAGPSSGDRCSRPFSYWLLNPTAGRPVEKVCSIPSLKHGKKGHYMDLMYLHSVVWESNGQEVTGRTSVAVLHHTQAARFDLQQHVWCFHIKHLRQWQRECHLDPKISGHKDAFSLCVVFWKIPTRTAFLAAHMMRFPSAVQVLHLTRTSSSFSASRSLTLIVFHSLADDARNSCNDAKNKQVVEDVSKITSACSGVADSGVKLQSPWLYRRWRMWTQWRHRGRNSSGLLAQSGQTWCSGTTACWGSTTTNRARRMSTEGVMI